MNNEIKYPTDALIEKVGPENAAKWTTIVQQMIEQDNNEEKLSEEIKVSLT